jgi:hypothetical protein
MELSKQDQFLKHSLCCVTYYGPKPDGMCVTSWSPLGTRRRVRPQPLAYKFSNRHGDYVSFA